MEKSSIQLLNFQEACAFLKIKESRLRTAILKKEIPFIKLGRLIRFDLNDLVTWLDSLKDKRHLEK